MTGIKVLPAVPSELIRLALGDLRKVESDVRYRVDMDAWHEGLQHREPCTVCMAGSVMAKTLGVDPERDSGPWNFQPDTDSKLCAIDAFRCGAVEDGLERLGQAEAATELEFELGEFANPPAYDRENPEPFHAAMGQLAKFLEEHNL